MNRRKFTPEAIAEMSQAHTGMRHSTETIEKMRASKLGPKNPMWGRKHSHETKEKMRQKRSTRPPPPLAPEIKQI